MGLLNTLIKNTVKATDGTSALKSALKRNTGGNTAYSTTPVASSAPRVDEIADLKQQLLKVDEEYNGRNNYGLSGKIETEKLSYTPLSDDEIVKAAKDKLTEFYLSSVNEINNNAARNTGALESSKDSLAKATEDKQREIESIYNEASKVAANDMLRRGVARSSIAAIKLSDIENSKAAQQAATSNDMFDAIYKIDTEIEQLETERQKALAEFDITYAAKLDTQILDMKEERQNRLDEVIKYNNELAAKQADYELKYAETDSKLDKDVYDRINSDIEYGTNVEVEQRMADAKFKTVEAYLADMPKEQALQNLKENEAYYVSQIGARHYSNLVYIYSLK